MLISPTLMVGISVSLLRMGPVTEQYRSLTCASRSAPAPSLDIARGGRIIAPLREGVCNAGLYLAPRPPALPYYAGRLLSYLRHVPPHPRRRLTPHLRGRGH